MEFRKLLFGLMLFLPFATYAEESLQTEIDRIQFNATWGSYFAVKNTGWGVCNNTQFVQLRGNAEQTDRFISLVLSAHLANRKVKFLGGCTNANGYLDATYLYVY